MNTSGEAADQVVRMSLEVGEAALKISGEGAKQLAVLLYAVLQDQSNSRGKTKGRTRLESLVRTGKPLKVFSVKESDLKKFAKEAKRYGILYCAIRNPKENTDGMVDIMVKEEDAPRINRIVERFKLSAVEEKAQVETEVETEAEVVEAEVEKPEAEKPEAEKPEVEKTKEGGKEKEEQNPSMAKTEKSHPSEPTFEKQEKDAEGTSKLYTGDSPERKSVREKLREIRAAKKQEAESKKQEVGLEDKKADTRKPSDKRTVQHKQPRQRKPKKKER